TPVLLALGGGSSGGSGVILHIALAPGLAPSPGRSWLRTTLLVPFHAFRSAQCTGPGTARPTGLRAAPGAVRGAGR
ncbi:hypothetical protein AB4212_31355, partial [Streptomyces sp. 2MCAF27]